MEIELLDRIGVDFHNGINTTHRAHVKDLGVGYLKLDQNDYDYGYFTAQELGAYRVSEIIGFGVVPLTVALEHPTFGPCIFSAEVKGGPKSLFHDYDYTPLEPAPYDITNIQTIACLDIIIGNTDRHGENYRTADDGRAMGIDHGLCFGARDGGSSRFVRWCERTENKTILPGIMDMVGKVNLDTIETELLKVGLSSLEIDKVATRILTMTDLGTIGWDDYDLCS